MIVIWWLYYAVYSVLLHLRVLIKFAFNRNCDSVWGYEQILFQAQNTTLVSWIHQQMDREQTLSALSSLLAETLTAHTLPHVFKCHAGSLVCLSPFLDCQLLEGSDLCLSVCPVLSITLASSRCLINIMKLMNQIKEWLFLPFLPVLNIAVGQAHYCLGIYLPPSPPSGGFSPRNRQSSLSHLLHILFNVIFSVQPPPTTLFEIKLPPLQYAVSSPICIAMWDTTYFTCLFCVLSYHPHS